MRVALGLTILGFPAVYASTWEVTVGANGLLAYDPPSINASAGDIVNFIFNPKNHTVTQSSFDAPCVPLPHGFTSGFVPVASTSELKSYPVYVPDTNPIWVHCEQTGHCGKGMVFAINAPADPSPHSFSAFKALAIAINGTSNATSNATSSAPPVAAQSSNHSASVNHRITVGADGLLRYNQSNITAAIGDTVTFEFHPKNHTVTQSSFFQPCQPLADTSLTGEIGFDSGFHPVGANDTVFPTFQITINDTAPIWGYCQQKGHCGSGMVFSINANESSPHSFAAYQALAIQINGTNSTTSATNSTTTFTASVSYTPATHSSSVPQPQGPPAVMDALADSASLASSSDISAIDTYAPIVIGLLALNVLVMLILALLGIVTFARRGRAASSSKAAYVPVKLREEAPALGAYDRPYSE